MNSKHTLRQVAVALLLLVAFLFQGTWALAGTTGGLGGTVTDEKGAAVAGAAVKAVSPSQSASATTDASGHFTFLSLAPDTYTVSIEKNGYNPQSFAGVTVFADNQLTLSFKLTKALQTIARVTSTSAGSLVKSGTTSDVYSVNAATAGKITGLGGGGSLDQAYSALASMPGAYVPVGGAGWYQNVYIRGGDYDQVGYEVDGVPVNRAFDNYPSNTASALGQQEVQLYTGASPSNSEGQGLSGYINQVIKTGTYPGFGTSDLGIGAPIFYHKANLEVGGASPDRRFSYYVGFGGYNQAYRVIDQSNGASYTNNWGSLSGLTCPAAGVIAGPPLAGCTSPTGAYEPGWQVYAPIQYYSVNFIPDRENVVNFHFAIPHRKDSGRDDLQVLWQGSDLKTFYDATPSAWGQGGLNNALNYGSTTAPPGSPDNPSSFFYPVSKVYTGTLGQTIPVGSAASAFAPVIKYCFPSADPAVGCNAATPIAGNMNDSVDNAVGIFKIQYQKNMGSNAYLRVYGYTVYSNWFNWGPDSANLCCTGVPVDYELFTHTRGVSATLADQINSKNLVQLQGSYSTATSTRMNNGTMFAGSGTRVGVLVDSTNPTNGICYSAAGVAANCDGATAAHFSNSNLYAYQNSGTALPAVAAATCGSGPCAWYIADNGYNGRNNTVAPRFGSGSLTDEWDPTDRLHVNLGLRLDSFQYVPSNSDGGTRPFWTNAWNNSYCYDASQVGSNPKEKASPTAACSSLGATFVPATVTSNSSTQTYTVWQPRVAATFTINPQNVLRFSYGKYDQAPNAAFEQYDSLNQNLPKANSNFFSLGFNAPTHPIRPEISYNTDLSWEHTLKGTDMSFKLTPFYRKTRDQIQQFFLDIRTNFVSGLNVGAQTSQGVEFQFQKGDFSKNGLSGMLSYTYTDAYVTYQAAPNGATPITSIDQSIGAYNAFTKGCATGGSSASATAYGFNLCGGTAAGTAAVTGTSAACYTTAGVADPTCAAGDIANPYWNAPTQSFYDPAAKYAPYDIFPNPVPGAGSYGSFVAPHVATLVLNYKHDKWAVTPAFQFSAGQKYGYPISTYGIDPSTCTGALASATSGDPRYPYGATGGAPYDAATCAQQAIPIPNPATNAFDAVGGFIQPSRLTMSMQLNYDVSPKLTVTATLANIFDTCFGGTRNAWTSMVGVAQNKICGYGGGNAGAAFADGLGTGPVGNNYNPGQAIQPAFANSYGGSFGSLPFNAYVDFKIKL